MDLSDPRQNQEAFVRAQTSLDPQESVVIWFTGHIYSFIPGERQKKLLSFEGHNVRRAVAIDGGWQLLTREAVFYKAPDSNEILQRWHNPLNDRDVEVVHVLNDPVNNKLTVDSPYAVIPYFESGDDLYFYTDVMLTYPSPLKRADYPLNSQSDVFQGAELFTFFVDKRDLAGDAASVPCAVNWTRFGSWLPWMEMSDAPGMVVYHCRGRKLMGGYAELPAHLQTYVDANHPEYRTAPTAVTGPNETSWTYYMKGHPPTAG